MVFSSFNLELALHENVSYNMDFSMAFQKTMVFSSNDWLANFVVVFLMNSALLLSSPLLQLVLYM
jgi:hypothetical protein